MESQARAKESQERVNQVQRKDGLAMDTEHMENHRFKH